MSELDTTIRCSRARPATGWRDVVLTDIGRETMLAIEGQARDMARVETARIDDSRELLTETLLFSRIGIAALVVVSLAARCCTRARRAASTTSAWSAPPQLRFERDRLEVEVERRTRDITQIANHLQTAREDERGSLARELHDELGGLLTAAKLDVARMRSRLAGAPPEVLERMTTWSRRWTKASR